MNSINKFFVCAIVAVAALLAFVVPPPSVNETGVGIRSYAVQTIADTATNATLANSDLTTKIAANQEVHIRYSIPFSLSAVNLGARFRITTPSGPAVFNSSLVVYSDADSIVSVSNIVAPADQATALATIGNHLAILDVYVKNGATAGNVVLQFAQNTSNTGNAILLRGAFADIVKF